MGPYANAGSPRDFPLNGSHAIRKPIEKPPLSSFKRSSSRETRARAYLRARAGARAANGTQGAAHGPEGPSAAGSWCVGPPSAAGGRGRNCPDKMWLWQESATRTHACERLEWCGDRSRGRESGKASGSVESFFTMSDGAPALGIALRAHDEGDVRKRGLTRIRT